MRPTVIPTPVTWFHHESRTLSSSPTKCNLIYRNLLPQLACYNQLPLCVAHVTFSNYSRDKVNIPLQSSEASVGNMTEQSSDTHSRPYLHHFHHPTSCQASISILTTNITFLYGPISRIPQQFQPSFLPLRVLPCVLCPMSQLVIQNSRFSKLQQKTSHTVAAFPNYSNLLNM